jgi:phage FluMu protein Com
MKIKCPKCKGGAELSPDFSVVRCEHCDLDMSYGEYVKFVAHSEAKYSDILGDYTGSTEGESAGSLDEWD